MKKEENNQNQDLEEKQNIVEVEQNANNTVNGTVKLSKVVSKSTIFLDFRQQEVFE